MIKNLCVIVSLTLPIKLMAGNIIDLYGDESNKSQKIVSKYSKRISDLENRLEKQFKENSTKEWDKISLLKNHLTNDIKKEGDYLYVDLNTIFYSNNKNKYTTIDVVTKSQPERMRFAASARMKGNFAAKNDLINDMIVFQNTATNLWMNGQLKTTEIPCPVYHCIRQFEHPQLKPYLKIFNEGAIKQKKLILDTMNSDPNPERRAAAAFLMGHFTNPREIIQRLLPHVQDKDTGVRNNVIRVIAETMENAKITQINLRPFLELLDSPQITDRNKALFVLLNTTNSKSAKQQIINQGGKNLLAILKLKQLNNHDIAYQILKRVSGKNYSEDNLIAWKKWVDTNAA
ncbi:HEAT repeat domain-containing protein [Legionella cardiaca]|uniref:HEAT repeat domain-containing protein n=1 Tax=Legionella cardiaca TaxID=1071983 RepID=A0ABY8AQY8_9GAMM|nr:HEAT repeat domain-containing protein [Legionella cardiaca]WED42953.1 HEAT repeat domain-containing protein [Legionella cardiaca]